MTRVKFLISFYCVLLCIFISMAISFSPSLRARDAQPQNAPAAGVSISVKMIDAADSQTDPAGKQYRASVSKAVNVEAGVQIPQGTPATVILVQGPGGWATQLASLTVGGQAVAVTSTSASVTSAAQSAAATAANTVGSVFGGFGHRAPPAAVTAVATGQRVVLPPGVTLTFIVATPGGSGGAAPTADAAPAATPAVSAAPETAAVPAGRPPIPAPAVSVGAPARSSIPEQASGNASSARSPIPAPAGAGAASSRPPVPAPGASGSVPPRTPVPAPRTPAAAVPNSAPGPALASAGGSLNAMEICFGSVTSPVMYLTAAFEVPVDTLRPVPVIEPAFSTYLKATYQYGFGITCQPIWSLGDAQQVQKKLADIRDRTKTKVVNTGWRYGQPPVTQGQSGFDPLAQGPGGLDLSQHRLTTYFCTLVAPGGTSMVKPPGPMDETAYVTSIFQADWDSAPVNTAFNLYMRDHYVHDLNLSDLSPRCGTQSPALQASMHQGAGVNKYITHKIAVDWTYTPAQAAEAKAAESAEAAHTAAQQAPTASSAPSGTFFISCSTSGGAGIDTYYTGVFPIKTARPSPRGGLDLSGVPNGSRSLLRVPDTEGLQVFARQLFGLRYRPDRGGGKSSPT